MTQPDLHSAPLAGDVLRAQVRALGIELRRPALAALVLLGVITLALARGIFMAGEVIDFHPEQLLLPGIAGLLFPVAVWHGQHVFGDGFLWTLPVDRRRHALIRTLAGWVWLMAAVALFVLWLLLAAIVSGGSILGPETVHLLPPDLGARMDVFPFPSPGPLNVEMLRTERWAAQPVLWLTPFTAATGAYLLASAIALGVRLRWVAATLLGLFLIMTAGEAADVDWLMLAPHTFGRPIFLGPYGFDTMLTARTEFLKVGAALGSGESIIVWRGRPHAGEWAVATLLWIQLGLLAVWLAASRHRERRPA